MGKNFTLNSLSCNIIEIMMIANEGIPENFVVVPQLREIGKYKPTF